MTLLGALCILPVTLNGPFSISLFNTLLLYIKEKNSLVSPHKECVFAAFTKSKRDSKHKTALGAEKQRYLYRGKSRFY